MAQVVETLFVEDNDPLTLHIQYHYCWWLNNASNEDISSHGIDIVIPAYPSIRNRTVGLVPQTIIKDFINLDNSPITYQFPLGGLIRHFRLIAYQPI